MLVTGHRLSRATVNDASSRQEMATFLSSPRNAAVHAGRTQSGGQSPTRSSRSRSRCSDSSGEHYDPAGRTRNSRPTKRHRNSERRPDRCAGGRHLDSALGPGPVDRSFRPPARPLRAARPVQNHDDPERTGRFIPTLLARGRMSARALPTSCPLESSRQTNTGTTKNRGLWPPGQSS